MLERVPVECGEFFRALASLHASGDGNAERGVLNGAGEFGNHRHGGTSFFDAEIDDVGNFVRSAAKFGTDCGGDGNGVGVGRRRLQRGEQRIDGFKALGRIFLEGLEDYLFHALRKIGNDFAGTARQVVDLFEGDGDGIIAGERLRPGDKFIEEQADGVNVCARADGLQLDLLGRQSFGRCPARGARCRNP